MEWDTNMFNRKDVLEFLKNHPNMTEQDYIELQRIGQKCNYCGELQFLASRHEPNCNLNPYFQNRICQLPRENYLMEIKN